MSTGVYEKRDTIMNLSIRLKNKLRKMMTIHLKGKLIFEGDDKDKKQNELDILDMLKKLEKLSSKLFPNGADTLKLSTDSTKFLNLYMMFKLT